jgi:uncharacterized protein YchJ
MHRILQTGFCVAGALYAWLDPAKLTQAKNTYCTNLACKIKAGVAVVISRLQAASHKREHPFKVLDKASDFVFAGRWQYVNGQTHIESYKPQREDVCLCGSARKFKKCCGL